MNHQIQRILTAIDRQDLEAARLRTQELADEVTACHAARDRWLRKTTSLMAQLDTLRRANTALTARIEVIEGRRRPNLYPRKRA